MKKEKILFIRIISTLLFAALLYYLLIPPFNVQSFAFWGYLIIIVGFYLLTATLNITRIKNIIIEGKNIKSPKPLVGIVLIVIFAIIFVINIFYSPVFNAKKYADRIEVDETVSFEEGVSEVDFSKILTLRKQSKN